VLLRLLTLNLPQPPPGNDGNTPGFNDLAAGFNWNGEVSAEKLAIAQGQPAALHFTTVLVCLSFCEL
jgi:hypothetical protein